MIVGGVGGNDQVVQLLVFNQGSNVFVELVQANPARLFNTTSNRIRGDGPNAVALRRNVGEKV